MVTFDNKQHHKLLLGPRPWLFRAFTKVPYVMQGCKKPVFYLYAGIVNTWAPADYCLVGRAGRAGWLGGSPRGNDYTDIN